MPSRPVLAIPNACMKVPLLTLLVFTVIWFHATYFYDLFFGTQQALSLEESSRFGEQFSLALLVAQMAVMVLLTPAYAAGSIAEEKERRTWQYQLATDLSNREIVLGKFFGRFVFLLGILMAGLPVLSLTTLIGGVDILFLIFAYLLTGSTVALLTAAPLVSVTVPRIVPRNVWAQLAVALSKITTIAHATAAPVLHRQILIIFLL